MTWQERHFDAIQFSVFDIELISKEQNVSHTEFECLEKKKEVYISTKGSGCLGFCYLQLQEQFSAEHFELNVNLSMFVHV